MVKWKARQFIITLLGGALLLAVGYVLLGPRPKPVSPELMAAVRRMLSANAASQRVADWKNGTCSLALRGASNDYLLLDCPNSLMEYMKDRQANGELGLGDYVIESFLGGKDELRLLGFRALLSTVDKRQYWTYDVRDGHWATKTTSLVVW